MQNKIKCIKSFTHFYDAIRIVLSGPLIIYNFINVYKLYHFVKDI